MNILFAHRLFPTQFRHLASALAENDRNTVVAIMSGEAGDPLHTAPVTGGKIRLVPYASHLQVITPSLPRQFSEALHDTNHGWAVYKAAQELVSEGFQPDVVICNSVWGEALYLKALLPKAKLIVHLENFYDDDIVEFDPSIGPKVSRDDRVTRLTRNAWLTWSAASMDLGIASLPCQKRKFPEVFHPRIEVVHEGIDTIRARPADTVFKIPGTEETLTPADEVITFAARELETMRGTESFLLSVPDILKARPKARVLIAGSEAPDVLKPHLGDKGLVPHLRKSLGDSLDPKRVHFLGRLEYGDFLRLLQVSTVHVYLTFPIVLSWSMLEAMACGCAIVTSRNSPVTDVIIDGENGVLVDFFNSRGIASAVTELLDDKERCDALAAAARRTIVENFDLKTNCLPRQIALIKGLVGNGQH